MTNFFTQNSEIIIRLAVAVVFGMVIGAERLLVHKEAGMKTHALVSLGAALFVIISEYLSIKYAGMSGFNSAMITGNIIVGVGFLGAGSIIFQNSQLKGITTAGGLWVTAGIGMAAGYGLFSLAIITGVLVMIIFLALNFIEKPIRRISDRNIEKDNNY